MTTKKTKSTNANKKQVQAKIINNKDRPTERKMRVSDSILKEIICLIAIAVSLLIMFSIFGNASAGVVGIWINKVLKGLFGFGAYILPFGIIGVSIFVLLNNKEEIPLYKILFCIGLFLIFISLVHILNMDDSQSYEGVIDYITVNFTMGSIKNGGFIGALIGNAIDGIFGSFSYVFLAILFIIFTIIITGKSFFKGLSNSYTAVKNKIDEVYESEEYYEDDYEEEYENRANRKNRKRESHNRELDFTFDEEKRAKKPYKILLPSEEINAVKNPVIKELDIPQPTLDIPIKSEKKVNEREFDIEIEEDKEIHNVKEEPIEIKEEPIKILEVKKSAKKEKFEPEEIVIIEGEPSNRQYRFPGLSLLQENNEESAGNSKQTILENSKKLEDTLKSFGVEAKVIEVSKGPTVTRYELSPGPGVKVSKISGLADDLALNLAANGIRIEAPIPGKAAVGIEVPNKETQMVYFREIIEDENFQKFPSKLAFGLGKDIAGKTVVTDIGKMPHLLIAGATGSGKSVCINTLITSILYKATPEEVKLIMIDPKVVELSVYSGIPHLLIPVVTEPKKAAGALNWAVREMLRRYDLFAQNSVRDLKGYNAVAEEKGEFKPEPQIVIIIDELADLMMAAPGEVEDSICRLAQMARAAGLHLIIATQRPSVDVITGVIKANVPSRLAFAVSSGTDSRTILDMVGAEKLLGRGDMLFYPVGTSKPIRIQGAFISDKEVEHIVEFLKQDNTQEYNQEMIEAITSSSKAVEISDDTDEFFEPAIEYIIQKEKASASMLQRQFRIGYNRASRLIEDLETKGIVGPEDGSKPRKVLITYAMWQDMQSGEAEVVEPYNMEETVETNENEEVN